jgi:integrase
MADLDLEQSPGRVQLRALDEEGEPTNKTRKKLWGFLSSETVNLLKELTRGFEPTDPLFPDGNSDKAYYHIMKGFRELGLTKRYGYLHKFTVHLHTFRTTNLALVKGWGFDADYAEALAGHAVGVKVSYQNIRKMAGEWLLKVEPNMRFLTVSEGKP